MILEVQSTPLAFVPDDEGDLDLAPPGHGCMAPVYTLLGPLGGHHIVTPSIFCISETIHTDANFHSVKQPTKHK